jgi:hypothetical protein
MPSTASAYYANEIGQLAAAEVTCYAPTDKVFVRPLVGTGTYWNAQYVGARFWIHNARTGKTAWLPVSGTAVGDYTWFLHQRVAQGPDGGFGFPRTTETAFANAPTYNWTIGSGIKSAGDWEFYVYAQYAWWTTTGAVPSAPIKTTIYANGWGNLTDCRL